MGKNVAMWVLELENDLTAHNQYLTEIARHVQPGEWIIHSDIHAHPYMFIHIKQWHLCPTTKYASMRLGSEYESPGYVL